MARIAVLLVAIVFIAGFGFLTLTTVSHQGLSIGSFLALFVLLLLTVGVVGSLRDPPRR
jgi:hypothetical protein